MSDPSKTLPANAEDIVATVRDRYGRLATSGASCCGPSSCCDTASASSTTLGYNAVELSEIADGADLGLGCGAPVNDLDLSSGETVLDLGSGAGIDVQLAARQVGSTGRVIGVDMTPEMLDRARALAADEGLTNVEFREGRLEALPIDDASIDAVTSNCVINLVPDKSAVFREMARVLRPGGRLVVSDIVLDGSLPAVVRDDVMAYVGCVSGAMQRDQYFSLLAEAGLGDVEILEDLDFLSIAGETLPEEIDQGMKALGIDRRDLEGVVRSVTYRAWRR
jgi:SAM-dependent methyltransferase